VRPDAELLAASDPEAFRELYDRYAGPVHGFFLRRTGDHEAALDLTAETFAEAWRSRHRFEDRRDGSIGPWLFGIARNVLTHSARDRRLRREASAALQLQVSSTVVPDESWLDGLDADVEAALAALPASQRRAVELRVMADRSYHEVADALACTPTAARIRVSRGLTTLRTSLQGTNDKELR
jgi:RNA polymerase sigma-70 factor (ECF subfamily)